MVLSDRTIERLLAEGRIEIEPYDPELLQPSSVDVRVDRYFRVFHNARYPYIDVRKPQEELTELVEVEDETPFILHPGEFVLGSTLERVRLPDDLVARLDGKPSLGRLGLLIHSTAGFIDPGRETTEPMAMAMAKTVSSDRKGRRARFFRTNVLNHMVMGWSQPSPRPRARGFFGYFDCYPVFS